MDNSPKTKEEALCNYLLCEYLDNPPKTQNEIENVEAPPMDEDFLQRIDQELAWRRIKKLHISHKCFRPATAAVLVLLLALSVTAVAQNWSIYNFLVSYGEHGVSVSNGDGENATAIYVDYSGSYVPSYIPTGYYIEKRTDGNNIISLEWQTDSGENIRFDQYKIKNQINLSKEPEDTLHHVLIQGQEGILIQSQQGKTILMWGTNPQFVLSGSILPEEAVKMAESISYCE